MQTNNKLREACANIAEYARSAMCHATDTHVLGYLNQIEGWAKAALAEPIKNCEVGTEDDWLERFSVVCERCSGSDCDHRLFKDEEVCDCFARWLQMPYKEGGAK